MFEIWAYAYSNRSSSTHTHRDRNRRRAHPIRIAGKLLLGFYRYRAESTMASLCMLATNEISAVLLHFPKWKWKIDCIKFPIQRWVCRRKFWPLIAFNEDGVCAACDVLAVVTARQPLSLCVAFAAGKDVPQRKPPHVQSIKISLLPSSEKNWEEKKVVFIFFSRFGWHLDGVYIDMISMNTHAWSPYTDCVLFSILNCNDTICEQLL